MPEELPQNLHPALERDIARLSEQIGKHRESPELKGAESKELIRESLRSLAPQPATPAVPQPPSPEDDGSALLPSYMQDEPAATKLMVEELLELSLHTGITQGLKEARKAGPYILDAFHDALVDKLYPELKKRGIVE
ncbi:MAG: hypothetical protein A3G64_02695 [Candidatus Liptonbacteria bacterium RIFCSPLOWO2_12_FULL_60_15]|nr:MAG: hypothetical protein A3G64_02695 [Candidatus Liptonbacteria bacterium RIFCSPLOWO2_12_FULL_60_15]